MTEMCSSLRGTIRLAAIVPFAACVLTASAASAQAPLGSAQSFAVLGAAIVTNTGPTLVTGDVGVSPAASITGFPPGIVVGTLHAGDLVAAQAQADASIANTQIKAMACDTHLTGQDLGAVAPLAPGVYCFDTSAQLTGTLFLTGAGPWIFQIGSTLTTAVNGAVEVVDAGTTCPGTNVYWQVGTSATLGVGTTFAGTILAGASATVMTGATVSGSVFALTGAVTLDTSEVSVCAAPVEPANQPPLADAGPNQVVSFGSLATVDGSASTDDGLVQALSYAWVLDTDPGFSAAGAGATVSLPVGTHVFTLTVDDGEFSTTDFVTITVLEVTAPTIAIAAPVADAEYALNEIVLASYTCTDASAITSCTGMAPSGTPIDTSSAGVKTFCVDAVDGADNTTNRCVSYFVLEPTEDVAGPAIAIGAPVADAEYALNQIVLASYTCTDGFGISNCTGTAANGAAIDTASAGARIFCVDAADGAGNTSNQCVSYSVLGPPAGGSPLGSAQSFAVLGASIVTNTGATEITGDLGVSPATSITGFPPGTVSGTMHAGDTVAAEAQVDAGIANLAFQAMTCDTPLTGQDLGAVGPLGPGVYCFDTSAQLTGTLFLTGAGPWTFQVGSTLTTASNAAVIVTDAGSTCSGSKVFWQVGTSATLGTFTQFAGTILAGASVTVMTGATVSGSVLALTGAVTLDTNTVSVCAPPVGPNQPPVADAGPDQVVGLDSLATLDGSASTDDGLLQPLSYTWVVDTDPGFFAPGAGATVALPAGTHVFTLTVHDGEFSATDFVTITVLEVTPPVISIAAPVADAEYALDQIVFASYTCTDASGIASCTGTAADGAPIDTSPAGPKTLCVDAVDGAGNTANQCVSYSVLEPPADVIAPAIAIATPVADAAYALNQAVLASYTCTDASGITSCTGTAADGAAIDTASAGARTFCVDAADGAGNTATQCVSYSVVEPPVGGSPLGSAHSFAVLGASIVTNTGPTILTGDLGVSPGTVITGFPPGVVVGTVHAADTVAAQAQADAGIASRAFAAMACDTPLTGQDLGAVGPLGPGVYCFDTSAQLTGTLFLTGVGPWTFQMGSTLTTAVNAEVIVVDAGATCSGANVFWQVGTSATLGVGTTFAGTILAGASVTAMTGATVSGSVLALTGAVTLDTNTISACAPPVEPANQPPIADAGPDQVVGLDSLVTLDGSASTDDGLLQPLSYAWVVDTDPGFSAAGASATVSLPIGTHVFTLTVHDGEFPATDSVTITVLEVTPPAIAIAAPVADAEYALDQAVFASYSCTDASGISSCTGTAADGAAIDTASAGARTFCVDAADGAGNTATQCVSYSVLEPPADVTAPTIQIASPGANAVYALDQVVIASYTCTDASGIASCTGTAADGAAIDTASAGARTFCVDAADGAGNTANLCASYSVLEPPTITVTLPIEPIYELGGLFFVEYSCGDPATWATCTGDVASGSALDTSTPGPKSFTITATDAAGNTTTYAVAYTVSLGMCVMPFADLTVWLPGDGSTGNATGPSAIWTGVEGYAAGKVGQGFLVGDGNYVSLLPFEQAGPFTVQAWLRTDTSGLPEFTGVLSTGGSAEIATSLQIELDGSGNYRLNAGDSAVSSLIGPALDFFQHLAVTFDGSTLSTYLNGQLVQSDEWTGSPLGFHVLNVGIDREGSHPFTGLVDEVQVFSRALSGDEVAQTFQAGASGLCNNRPPVAVAVAVPNPAEATGPGGAIVSLDGTGSSDPEVDMLTCTWHEGSTLLGTGCTLPIELTTGSHTITLTVDDGEGETSTSDVVVVVADTTGPTLNVPSVVFAEATAPLGAIVFYAASATDAASGPTLTTCAPASGSFFAIGSTVVTCSATDAAGNTSSVTFSVNVSDTIAPEVLITSSADALLSGSTFTVVARASDIVGVATVTVNGVEATRTGTAQAGTWVATVPITLPVAPGDVRRFEVRATDEAGHVGTATLLVDNDGIAAAMDRHRVSGLDESGLYSSDFVHGPTAGTVTRNGWTIRLSSAATPGGVQATISGSGGIARISACTGAAKEVRLNVPGETADITCAAAGTITVKAISAVLQIELREQLATGAWQQFHLRTGQSMSVGSPATASSQNVESIDVYLLEMDGDGQDTVVGSYQLRPGASVDVSAAPRARGRDGRIHLTVLSGSVSVTVSGRMRTLRAGQRTTMQVERTLAVRRLPAR